MRITETEIKNLIRDTIEEEISSIKEAGAYRDFFMDTLKKAGDILDKNIDSPEDLTPDEKKGFFNYIDSKWDEEAGEIDDSVDVELRDMLGEAKIRERVRKEIRSYIS